MRAALEREEKSRARVQVHRRGRFYFTGDDVASPLNLAPVNESLLQSSMLGSFEKYGEEFDFAKKAKVERTIMAHASVGETICQRKCGRDRRQFGGK